MPESHDTPEPRLEPAIPGFRSGVPAFEHSSLLTQVKKTGSYGSPGKYYELVASWPHCAAAVKRDLAEASALTVQTQPLEDETPEEEAFNDALGALLLGDRVLVDSGDGHRIGIGEMLAQMRWGQMVGFAVVHSSWRFGAGLFGDDCLILSPALQAAVSRFTEEAGRMTGVVYQHSNGGFGRNSIIPADSVIHAAWGIAPLTAGNWFGQGWLRPLIFSFEDRKESIFSRARSLMFSAGIGKGYAGKGELGTKNRAALEAILKQWASDGRNWVVIPDGKAGETDLTFEYPSGTPPDFGPVLDSYDREVDALFEEQALSLGVSGHGSRAVAEEMRQASANTGRTNADLLVSLTWRKIGQWVAAQEGYGGRIRNAESVGEDATDVGARVTNIATAKNAGLLGEWGRSDSERMREELDLTPLDDIEDEMPDPEPEEQTAAPVEPVDGPQSGEGDGEPPESEEEDPAELACRPGILLADSTPRLVVVAGVPGSGKSARATQIAREADGPVTTISPDAFLDRGTPKEARAIARAQLEDALQRGDSLVVFDQPLLTAAARQELVALARRNGYAAELVWVSATMDEAKARNATRPEGRRLSDRAIEAMFASLTPPDAAEGWESVSRVDSNTTNLAHDAEHSAQHDAQAFTITGADGIPIPHYRPALTVNVRGVDVMPETHIPLATDIARRLERDRALQDKVERFLLSMRRRLFDALATGGPEGALTIDAEENRLAGELATIIGDHLDGVRSDIGDSRQVEANAQRDTGVRGPGMTPAALRGATEDKRRRLSFAERQAARTIVRKASSEVEEHWVLAGSSEGFVPGRNAENYVREVDGLTSAVEAGEVGVAEAPEPGMLIVSLIRVSAKDRKVCGVCKEDDGLTFNLPEDLDALEAYRDLPDQLCTSAAKNAGKTLCRCTWASVWGFDDEPGSDA